VKSRILWIGLLLLITPGERVYAQDQTPTGDTGRGVVSLPDKPWGVQLDLPGFTITFSGMKPDGRRYLVANNSTSGVVVSVTLEEMPPGRSGKSCKEIMNSRVANTSENITLYENTGGEMKHIRIWQAGDKTFLEYMIPKAEAAGLKPIELDQQNRFLCMEHDNVFVDLHVSKTHFQPGDQKLFDPIFDSVQFHEGLTRTVMDYFLAGTSYYRQSDFKRAIPFYVQALALEQQDRKFEKKYWYVLVDSLGMAYAMTGDLEIARETFEYGIQNDPDYPVFIMKWLTTSEKRATPPMRSRICRRHMIAGLTSSPEKNSLTRVLTNPSKSCSRIPNSRNLSTLWSRLPS
jgi:tetratricopeptide (TPR) repeat protein